MSLRDRIQDWLGISEILMRQTTDRQLIMDQSQRLGNLDRDIAVPLSNISAILLDEHSAARKAASNRINNEAFKRLNAEAKAREPYNGQ